jgi:uncharacterized protein YuzE
MSRILKRPMFKRGGQSNDGIMSNVVDRKQYALGSIDEERLRSDAAAITGVLDRFAPIQKTRLPLGEVGFLLASGADPIDALGAGYSKFVKADDVRQAALAKRRGAAVSTALSSQLKTPATPKTKFVKNISNQKLFGIEAGATGYVTNAEILSSRGNFTEVKEEPAEFEILTKEEVIKNYPTLDSTKAYKRNKKTKDIIQIGSGGVNIDFGKIEKQSGATAEEKKILGVQQGDEVVVKKDSRGNIIDFEITSSVDNRMQKIGKAVKDSKLQEADDALREIENYIVQLKREGYENLPGIGFIQGKVPGPLVSKQGLKLRALLSKYENITLKARSGSAVTPSEFTRVQSELAGAANTADESVFLEILQTNRSIMEKQKKATFALYRDEDVKAYQDSGGLSLYPSPLLESTEELRKKLEEDN